MIQGRQMIMHYHERRQSVLVFLGLRAQVFEIEVPISMGLYWDHFQTRHDRRLRIVSMTRRYLSVSNTHCRIGAVRTDRNEADVSVTLSARFMVRPDDRQASVLSGGARVGLERASRETSNLAKVLFEFLREYISYVFASLTSKQYLDKLPVPLNLVFGRKRMHGTELGPSERDHAARAVQLHRATTQGYHRMVKAEIL